MTTETVTTFSEFYLSDTMLRALSDIGYTKPTPVQANGIPLVMAGIDLIVQSQTGTGKTAAFAIPTLEMLGENPGVAEVLVLAPTRELARQVAEEFGRLGAHKKLDIATIYGGVSYEKQYEELDTAQVICATPGRLRDILERGKLDLGGLRILILDEADEMLSMGFAEDLNAILSFLPEERQSLLFSATITQEVKALSAKMLYYPEFVTHSGGSVAAVAVQHAYYTVKGVGRARDLLNVLDFEEPDTAIIFANTKDDTFMVAKFLKRHGRRAEVLNGDLPQKERERTLKAFREGKIDFLVATDVAARGIDVSELSHVFNFTLPDSAEVYIHRTGRTGRAGKEGRAISLISPREIGTLFNIRKLYKMTLEQHALPTPQEVLEVKQRRLVSKLAKSVDSMGNIAYGSKLGIAQHLLANGSDRENLKLLAKLLTLADGQGTPSVVEVEPQTEVEAAKAGTAPETAVEAQPVEATEPESKPEDDGGQRRRSRKRHDSDEPKNTETIETRDEVANDDDAGRRRRRRRKPEDSAKDERPKRESRDERPKRESRDERPKRESRDERPKRESRDERPKRESRDERPSHDEKDNQRSRGRRPEKKSKAPEIPMSKVWVSLGKEHFESADDVVNMVCYMAGMDPEDVGRVSVETSFTYVEVRDAYFYDIINAMNNQDWNGVTVAAEPARR